MLTWTMEWPINSIEVPAIWASKYCNTVLIGDAAHAMVPYMALGAAMAVEDAAAMATTLKYVKSKEDLLPAINMWVEGRTHRVRRVHEASFANGLILHLPDGPVQRARDEAMRAEVGGDPFVESADQWADPILTEWAYGHDPVLDMDQLWLQHNQRQAALERS